MVMMSQSPPINQKRKSPNKPHKKKTIETNNEIAKTKRPIIKSLFKTKTKSTQKVTSLTRVNVKLINFKTKMTSISSQRLSKDTSKLILFKKSERSVSANPWL
jgi:hypothetical protein